MNLKSIANFTYACIGLISFTLGYFFATKSWDGKVTARVYLQGRVLANTTRPMQDPLLIETLIRLENNIISSLKITRDKNKNMIGLVFGNYITESGQDLCSLYRNIEVTLFGDNVANSGKHPRLIIQGVCPTGSATNSSQNSTSLNINGVFPLLEISECDQLQNKESVDTNFGTKILFSNLEGLTLGEPDWILERVTFSDQENEINNIDFDINRIRQIILEKNAENIKIRCWGQETNPQ